MTTTSKYTALAEKTLERAQSYPHYADTLSEVARALERAALEAKIEELKTLGEWVRRGDYNADDARDEIARAVENRTRELAARA